MRVFYNEDTNRYWLACPETKRVITINRAGAYKVASVCAVHIEKKSTDEILNVKRDFQAKIKEYRY